MPTVVNEDGFRVKVLGPPREHPPPHVHVYKGRGVVVIRFGSRGTRETIWEVYDMKPADVVKAFRLVEANAVRLRKAWEAIHG